MGKNARCFGQDLMRGEHVVRGGRVNAIANPTSKENIPGYYRKRDAGMSDDEIIAEYESGLLTSGTSIFDPVLCELMYRWFCPPGGVILDPFAGGSVRGIVASKMGRRYVGVDLRAEQIEANREQAGRICGCGAKSDSVAVNVSGKWLRHCFECTPEYIKTTCRGRCCQGTGEILVSLLPAEQTAKKAAGLPVADGMLLAAETGVCPHKEASGFCGVHGTDDKPFGCIASPFTLNNGGTLIVRNRYTRLKCHGHGEPAFKTFRTSLDLIFGEMEAGRIADASEAGADTIPATMSAESYERLRYLDGVKHGRPSGEPPPLWHVGDSLNLADLCGDVEADLVFTCPPYADLEVYSEDPLDISTMDYPDFLAAYRTIIGLACERLKLDRFAAIVVGDIRDKVGNYRNFVGDTVKAFADAGLALYNDGILVTALGSLPIRVGKQFTAGRKLGKTHQNVLVFVKGDGKAATAELEDGVAIDLERMADMDLEPRQA